MPIDPLHTIEKVAAKTNTFMGGQTRNVFNRYPLLFSCLIVFGVVATLHGFESIIEYIPYLREHPAVVFVIGVSILIFTGSLYKRLDKRVE